MPQFYYIYCLIFIKITLWIVVQRLENTMLIQDKSMDKENSDFWFTHTVSSHITPISSNITHNYLSHYFPHYKPFP